MSFEEDSLTKIDWYHACLNESNLTTEPLQSEGNEEVLVGKYTKSERMEKIWRYKEKLKN